MAIHGLEGLSDAQFHHELKQGGKFVVYRYCISLILITFRRSSSVYFIKNGESRITPGLPFTLISLLLGWWGFPWGIIYTFTSIGDNFMGGRDVTQDILEALEEPTTEEIEK